MLTMFTIPWPTDKAENLIHRQNNCLDSWALLEPTPEIILCGDEYGVRELAADQEDLEARKREELLTLGESALNLLTRRRSSSMISRSSRKRTLTKKAQADVEESLEAIEDFEQQLEDLKAQWEEQAAEISDVWADKLEEVEEFEVKPRRADVTVEFCGLAWVPVWRVMLEDGRQLDLPARELVAKDDRSA